MRIKIAALWFFTAIAFVAYLLIGTLQPGAIQQIIAGEIQGTKITPEYLLLVSIIILAPLAMAFLSLTLKASTNRWANLAVGAILIIFELIILAANLQEESASMSLLTLSKIVALALILNYAWKSTVKK